MFGGIAGCRTCTGGSVSATNLASQVAEQEHTINIAAEFTPASVTIAAMGPARLHFRRSDKPTCADEIVIPELNMRKKIAANETVTFELPVQRAAGVVKVPFEQFSAWVIVGSSTERVIWLVQIPRVREWFHDASLHLLDPTTRPSALFDASDCARYVARAGPVRLRSTS